MLFSRCFGVSQKFVLLLFALSCLLSASPYASAGLITISFEEVGEDNLISLTGSGATSAHPKGTIYRVGGSPANSYEYRGFTWTHLGILKSEYEATNRGYYRGLDLSDSGEYIGYSDLDSTLTITRGGDSFDFLGGYFTPANYNEGTLKITATYANEPTRILEYGLILNAPEKSPSFIDFDGVLNGVVALSIRMDGIGDKIASGNGRVNQVVFDGLRFNVL